MKKNKFEEERKVIEKAVKLRKVQLLKLTKKELVGIILSLEKEFGELNTYIEARRQLNLLG